MFIEKFNYFFFLIEEINLKMTEMKIFTTNLISQTHINMLK